MITFKNIYVLKIINVQMKQGNWNLQGKWRRLSNKLFNVLLTAVNQENLAKTALTSFVWWKRGQVVQSGCFQIIHGTMLTAHSSLLVLT